MIKQSFINIDEIRIFYEEFCEEENASFSEEDFENFIDYLEYDFFDWLRQNLSSFRNDKETSI